MLLLSLFDLLNIVGQIIFLRHGQAKNNTERILSGRTPGVPLTDKGITQAQQTAELLEHMNISAIYSSPIQRAKHTAEIAVSYTHLRAHETRSNLVCRLLLEKKN